jgi:hypothetical protein
MVDAPLAQRHLAHDGARIVAERTPATPWSSGGLAPSAAGPGPLTSAESLTLGSAIWVPGFLYGRPFFYVYAAGLMDETLYDGLAHEAAFYVPTAGMVRFVLSPAGASAYVRSRKGSSLARVQSRDRLFLTTGEHVLILYDPKLPAHVSIVLTRD